jgi:hypothetical protein
MIKPRRAIRANRPWRVIVRREDFRYPKMGGCTAVWGGMLSSVDPEMISFFNIASHQSSRRLSAKTGTGSCNLAKGRHGHDLLSVSVSA